MLSPGFSKGLVLLSPLPTICLIKQVQDILLFSLLCQKTLNRKIAKNKYCFPSFILNGTPQKVILLNIAHFSSTCWVLHGIRNSPCGVTTTYLCVVSTWGLPDCTEIGDSQTILFPSSYFWCYWIYIFKKRRNNSYLWVWTVLKKLGKPFSSFYTFKIE